eukprot:4811408-Prymnesium_polylepis.1
MSRGTENRHQTRCSPLPEFILQAREKRTGLTGYTYTPAPRNTGAVSPRVCAALLRALGPSRHTFAPLEGDHHDRRAVILTIDAPHESGFALGDHQHEPRLGGVGGWSRRAGALV